MSAELFHVIAMIVLRQTAHGPIALIPRYDGHERVWTAPMPCLFQRQIGGVRRVTSTGTVLNNLARRRCEILGETNPAFRGPALHQMRETVGHQVNMAPEWRLRSVPR
jgi:hypothetical protein